MKPNKKGNSPTFVLEFKDFDIKELVYSTIIMFSVFIWDNTFKNPKVDKELNKILKTLDKYIKENYKEV